jgi:hypothetical protein
MNNTLGKAHDRLMRDFTSSASRFILASLLVGCFTLVFLAPSYAQDAKTDKPTAVSDPTSAPPASPQPTAPAQPAIPAQPKSPTVNPVTQAAVQAGVLVCASRINQVMTFLTANTRNSAYLFTPQSQPDQSIFSVSLGIEVEKATAKYASASFAPTTNGQVAAVYDTVEYVAQSCADAETSIFKSLKRKGNLGKDIVILDGGPVTVFLMPAGSGCIIIRKEVVR